MARARSDGPAEPEFATMGDRLRRARTSRGLSLRTVARRLGVSPSLISQVETGRAKPSVSTLYALANELGISLDELLFVDTTPLPAGGAPHPDPVDLLEDPFPRDPVQRSNDRVRISLGNGVSWERLTTESLRHVDFFYVTYEPSGASSPTDEYQRHNGREWGYVLNGTLHVAIGFDQYVLHAGDAIMIDSSTPHRMSNPGDAPVHAVWFALGRRSGGLSAAPRRR